MRRPFKPLTISEAADARAREFPEGVCLVCAKAARTISSRTVPSLLRWARGDAGDQEVAAEALKAHPGVEGCFVAPGCGISICATRGVVK
jgi:hypothetical protein